MSERIRSMIGTREAISADEFFWLRIGANHVKATFMCLFLANNNPGDLYCFLEGALGRFLIVWPALAAFNALQIDSMMIISNVKR